MAVYVRPLSEQETQHIYHLLDSNIPEEVKKRLRIILYSSQGYKAPEITPKVNIHPKTVRKWIKVYDQHGFEGLLKKGENGGLPQLLGTPSVVRS
ncbi:MAG: helix-turn-helix domain-containing protein [Actinomycetota bacterium]|nr:helix-turn-helix domain-containing protein [Actinomycetota bacterium]